MKPSLQVSKCSWANYYESWYFHQDFEMCRPPNFQLENTSLTQTDFEIQSIKVLHVLWLDIHDYIMFIRYCSRWHWSIRFLYTVSQHCPAWARGLWFLNHELSWIWTLIARHNCAIIPEKHAEYCAILACQLKHWRVRLSAGETVESAA